MVETVGANVRSEAEQEGWEQVLFVPDSGC